MIPHLSAVALQRPRISTSVAQHLFAVEAAAVVAAVEAVVEAVVVAEVVEAVVVMAVLPHLVQLTRLMPLSSRGSLSWVLPGRTGNVASRCRACPPACFLLDFFSWSSAQKFYSTYQPYHARRQRPHV